MPWTAFTRIKALQMDRDARLILTLLFYFICFCLFIYCLVFCFIFLLTIEMGRGWTLDQCCSRSVQQVNNHKQAETKAAFGV